MGIVVYNTFYKAPFSSTLPPTTSHYSVSKSQYTSHHTQTLPKERKMPTTQPPAWFFGTIAGGVVAVIILLAFVAGLIKYMRTQRRLEAKDLEKSHHTQGEMAEVDRPGPIRRATEADLNFVDVDLRDPVVRSQSVYSRVRDSLSLSVSRGG